MSYSKTLSSAILILLGITTTGMAAPASVSGLRCEYKTNPVGIDVLQPRLSWRLQSSERGVVQKAYRLQVANSPQTLDSGEGLLWDTKRIESDQPVHVVYEGPAVVSAKRYYWRVRV